MQKTAQEVGESKSYSISILGISALLGPSIWLALIGSWSGKLHWILPVLLILSFSAALSKWAVGIFRKTKAHLIASTIGIVIVASCWIVQWLIRGTHPGFALLWLSLAAVLIGSMVVSWLEYGFADETFIPTPEISVEIQQKYRDQNDYPARLPLSKQLFDIGLATFSILVTLPLWLLIGLLIWLQDPGPILFIKHCSGYRGKPFRLYKFRTMRINAEADTGPISSDQQDGRVRGVCRILRKTALDELPQLINILIGEMSFVGPRPLRSVVEIENIHQIPGYTHRFNTLPGLAGLAQICGDNLMASRDKLRYERIYANHASVLFDIKLVVIACLIVFYLRWKSDWNGRIPRAWIRFGS